MNEHELSDHLKAKMADVKLDTLRQFADDALAEVGKMEGGMDSQYGGICVALGAIAAAAAKAADRSEHGGITGFQAGAVFWEFTKQWGTFGEGPKRMVSYGDMLYPQYADKFDRTISADTWKWLQEKAAEKLVETPSAHDAVLAHWASIVSGTVPFGFTVVADV